MNDNNQLETLSLDTANVIFDAVGSDGVLDVVTLMIGQFGDRMIAEDASQAAAFLAQLYVTVGILGQATASMLTATQRDAALAKIKGQVN